MDRLKKLVEECQLHPERLSLLSQEERVELYEYLINTLAEKLIPDGENTTHPGDRERLNDLSVLKKQVGELHGLLFSSPESLTTEDLIKKHKFEIMNSKRRRK